MPRLIKKAGKKAGQPPGTLVHVGDRKVDTVRLTVIDYDKQNHRQEEVRSVEACSDLKGTGTTSWINLDGLHEVGIIEEMGKTFDLHPLVLEDILNTNQRPKVEDHGDHLFVVVKIVRLDEDKRRIRSEQVSLVLGRSFLLSFQESVGDVFDSIRKRIGNARLRIRRLGTDYLLYALIDCIVDYYFVVLEKIADRIEALQEEVAAEPTTETLRQIHELKREMVYFRKATWPVRELINGLLRSESSLIAESTEVYLRDVYDHIVQVIDTAETYREMISGMLDVYLSSISNRMNTVMKVLTIIATIFIPLTFIAGIYGMNFKHMPELEWRWGYPVVWLTMSTVVVVMLVYFRRKKWL